MSDTDEIQSLYLRLLQGWNNRDANMMAQCFSDEGVMIGFDGSLAEGSKAVRDHLTPIFADHPTATFVAIIRSTRTVGSLGILRADAGMVPPGGSAINPAANARQTVVARKMASGEWQVEIFQNTPAALHWDEETSASLTAELNAAITRRGPLPDR